MLTLTRDVNEEIVIDERIAIRILERNVREVCWASLLRETSRSAVGGISRTRPSRSPAARSARTVLGVRPPVAGVAAVHLHEEGGTPH